ncbi:uncharacterized protein NPIL_250901 [Nephila pilipes]|uniref:Uncharacterized protein n=1 Tax=Nephila pilipes TaxID=299642 RepID=A0A8X6PCS7_NEPPI|nr:uncharacterized protein NPIL_250901 [Nephila pilipes]
MRLIWKLLKSAIFIVCVGCFSWQSTDFFQLYFTYPTATSVDLTFPDELIKPAITMCNSNPVKREDFCNKYPHLCQEPSNVTAFCEKHPYFCEYDPSNIVIPKLNYYARDNRNEAYDALFEIYSHYIMEEGADYWSWESPYKSGRGSKMKATFVYDYSRIVFITCYSSNLHIYGNEEVETIYSEETFRIPNSMNGFVTEIRDYDTFFPWSVPRILLSVHSPFVPINPFDEGMILEKYHEYYINVRMEEEHLLESPYQTNCTDYEDLWKKNNKTGPRSQEMCRERCRWNFFQSCNGCENGFSMVEKPKRMCKPGRLFSVLAWKIVIVAVLNSRCSQN